MKPDDGYIAYIVNPKSGASSSKLTSRLFEKYLVKKGFEVRAGFTTSLDNACELATDAAVGRQRQATADSSLWHGKFAGKRIRF